MRDLNVLHIRMRKKSHVCILHSVYTLSMISLLLDRDLIGARAVDRFGLGIRMLTEPDENGSFPRDA